MPCTDAFARVAAFVAFVAACRSTAMPEPSADAATAPSPAVATSATVEAEPPRREWPSKTSTAVVRLRVRALTCHGCAWQIGETLAKDHGVADVSTSVPDKLVTVRYDAANTTATKIRAALAEVGYESEEAP